MTLERMAKAIVILGDHMDPSGAAADVPFDEKFTAVLAGLRRRDPNLKPMVEALHATMRAYMGDTMEQLARELITTVAAGNKAKIFQLFVVEGEGIGAWETVVRRNRNPTEPAFLKPGTTQLILPERFK